MNLYIAIAILLALISILGYGVSYLQEKAITEHKLQSTHAVIKDKINDAKIASRPDDDALDLLDRMRREND